MASCSDHSCVFNQRYISAEVEVRRQTIIRITRREICFKSPGTTVLADEDMGRAHIRCTLAITRSVCSNQQRVSRERDRHAEMSSGADANLVYQRPGVAISFVNEDNPIGRYVWCRGSSELAISCYINNTATNINIIVQRRTK